MLVQRTKRSCVPLRAHPQEHEIEPRQWSAANPKLARKIVFVLTAASAAFASPLDEMHMLRITLGLWRASLPDMESDLRVVGG